VHGEEEALGNFHGGWRARTSSIYSARTIRRIKFLVRDSTIAHVGKDSFPALVWHLCWRSAGGSSHAIWRLKCDSAPFYAAVGDTLRRGDDKMPRDAGDVRAERKSQAEGRHRPTHQVFTSDARPDTRDQTRCRVHSRT
jgi:hypothetical protein